MKKFLLLGSFVALAFASAPRMTFASTVTLYVEAASSSPYVFDIDGAKTFQDLTCLNDQRYINVGESWDATATTLDVLISQAKTALGGNYLSYKPDGTLTIAELEADAYLDSMYGSNTTTNQEIQDAIWTILDSGDAKNPSSYVYTGLSGNTEDAQVRNDYSLALGSLSTNTSAFYSDFTFYQPIGNYKDDQNRSTPQEFLGYKSVTPEPSSLILLGTGLAGLAGSLRRRMKATAKA